MVSPADLVLLRSVEASGRYLAANAEEARRLYALKKQQLVAQSWNDAHFVLLPAGVDVIRAADAALSEAERQEQEQRAQRERDDQQKLLDRAQHVEEMKQQRRHDFKLVAFSCALTLVVDHACDIFNALVQFIEFLTP